MPPGLQGEDYARLALTTRIFEEKTAREACYQYSGDAEKIGPAWRSDTFDYMVSKCLVAGPWLAWAEGHGPVSISHEEVPVKMSHQLMADDLSPSVLSHHV